MNQAGKKTLTLNNFSEQFKKNQEQKHLEEALVYLKLRSFECPKKKALLFARKKQKCIDGTVKKDGPAGFRKLVPEKPERNLVNGWLKNEKLKYKNLRGYSEEIKRNISKEKEQITRLNQKERVLLEENRKKMKIANQPFLVTDSKQIIMNQIASMKDEFLKDREKRNLFLSYKGHRLDQHTKQFFNQIQDVNPNGLVVKLGAFNTGLQDENVSIQTDWEIAKGRSLTSYEVAGTHTKKEVSNFRQNLEKSDISFGETDAKFRKTLNQANKLSLNKTKTKFSKEKRVKQEEDEKKFYDNLEKVLHINKNYRSMDDL